MPRCNNCNAETVNLFLCARCSVSANRQDGRCRTCHAVMTGKEAICPACGATGNPHGTPPPPHVMLLIQEVLNSRRTTGGPVLYVSPGWIPRAYILRVLRENMGVPETDIEGIVMAVPENLPKGMTFKATFIDPGITDENVKEAVKFMVERPPGPSVYEWLRKPAV